MAKIQRVEGEIELKCDADTFFENWARKPYRASSLSPNKHPKVELHEGDWCSVGSVLTWNYVLDDGERSFVRTKIEEIDEKKKSVIYNVIEGEVVKALYKSFKSKVEVVEKGNKGGCRVKWSVEVEKKDETAPEPVKYLDFLLSGAKDIDANL